MTYYLRKKSNFYSSDAPVAEAPAKVSLPTPPADEAQVLAFVDTPNIADADFRTLVLVFEALEAKATFYNQGGKRMRNINKLIKSTLHQKLVKCPPYKDVDAIMAGAIFEKARDADTIIIVSGDQDFLPAAKSAKKHGCKVIIVSIKSKLSREFKRIADQVVFLEPRPQHCTRYKTAA